MRLLETSPGPEKQKKRRPEKFLVVLRDAIIGTFLLLLLGIVPDLIRPPTDHRLAAWFNCKVLVAAINAYKGEYGRWPTDKLGAALDEASQAKLIRVLQANDSELNPRQIVFFERPLARDDASFWRAKRYHSGIHPETGVYLDPWGNPYRVAFDAGDAGKIASPYGAEREIQAGVIVWSLGKDGKQGFSDAPDHRKRNNGERADDIVSWED